MKRLAAVALLVAGMVPLPAWAQRGGARGGGSGHGMTASSGGFASGSRSSYAGSRMVAPRMIGGNGYASVQPGLRTGSSYINRRPVVGAPGRYRGPYLPVPYGYGVVGWINPDYFDYSGYSDQPVDQGPVYNGAAAQPYDPENDPGPYGAGPLDPDAAPPGPGPYQPAYRPSQPEPANQDAVTLIFKDGRASEQIHNYILTSKTLFVQDAHRREIAVADLDLAATQKVNHDAGVDFQLPQAPR